MDALPTFKCLPKPVGQHRTTTHLLPDEDVITESMEKACFLPALAAFA